MNVNWKPESDRPALDETKTGRAGLTAPEGTAAAADHPRRRGGPREMRPDREPLPPAIRAKPGQKTTTKADLIKAVYRSNPALSHVQAKNIYETAIEEISAALVRGEVIKLSRFGVFSIHAKGPRVGRNPRTRVEAPITARRVLTFKASPSLTALVAKTSREDDHDGRSPAPLT